MKSASTNHVQIAIKMAIISDKYQAIFIHIYKTGGTSIRSMIDDKQMIHAAHATALDAKKAMMGDARWNDYWKFTIVRNPYDLVESLFYHHRRDNPRTFPTMEDQLQWIKRRWGKTISHTDGPPYISQHEWLTENGQMLVDNVFKFDDLQDVHRSLFELRGYNAPFPLPKLNDSLVRPKQPIGTCFTPNQIALINQLYAADFAHFKYSKITE